MGILEEAPAQGNQSDSNDPRTDSVTITAGDVSNGCPLINYIPQPDAGDAWANSAGMGAVNFPSDPSFINDIPQPDASDAWANLAGMGAVYFLSDPSFMNDIPQPDANDAWANLAGMEAVDFPSDPSFMNDIPQPGAGDAWANSAGMEAVYFPPDPSLINDIPQPDANDAWANLSIQTLEDMSLGSHMGNDFDATIALVDRPGKDSESTTQSHSIASGRDAAVMTPVQRSAEISRTTRIAQPPVNANRASPALRCSSLQSPRLRKESGRAPYHRSSAVK